MSSHRVYRGGNWCSRTIYCRSAYRSSYYPSVVHYYLGFRPILKKESEMDSNIRSVEVSEEADGELRYLMLLFEGDVECRFVWIEPGRFLMGEGATAKETEIEEGFWMLDTPVTQELYQKVMGENPSYFVGPKHPVETVSAEDAERFCEKLNELLGDYEASLPSSAEWEYACRAGTTSRYNNGRDDLRKDEACFDAEEPCDVGSYPPNRWGLYDMHGLVWEATSDDYK